MKKYITSFFMTQSMFCALPFPCKTWDESCRTHMMLFLPFIGLEIGILWVILHAFLWKIGVPSAIYSLIMCGYPYFITGFIHLDGFMDVTDAIGSWRDLEKRRLILKDSHVGSFAVIWCIFLILSGFAVFSTCTLNQHYFILLFIPALSRCCSALAIMNLKPMSTSQYAHTSSYPKSHSLILVFLLLGLLFGAALLHWHYAFVLFVEFSAYITSLKKGYRSLDGMNGDISGYCICISELCAIITIVFLS